jgi:hypothetical protein
VDQNETLSLEQRVIATVIAPEELSKIRFSVSGFPIIHDLSIVALAFLQNTNDLKKRGIP